MGESEEQAHLDVEGLSLIDVSSENDCLISPQTHPTSERGSDRKSVKFTEPSYMEAMVGSSEDMEQGQHSPNSWGPEKKSKGGKYNLRKSLAWDSAFFTSAGFLDPEELSTMIGVEKCSLPGIQEDINKSCDSLTTLDSEALTLESLEAELFEDIRASIQKTSKASSFSEKDFGVKESKILSLNKVKDASQDKMKVKAAAKKPSCSTQESLRTLNRVSIHHQASQPVSRIKNLPKATRGTRQITPVSATTTKRISSGFKNAEMEKDAKTATGRETTVLKPRAPGVPKNVLRRPIPPTKTSIPSISSSRKELTSSCSSSESAGTAFSDKNSKSSLELVNGGNRPSRSTTSSSSNTIRTPKVASRNNHLTESLELANYLKSATVSNVSPAGSISEWSSASSSATVAVDQMSSSAARASLGARASNSHSKDKESMHGLDSHHQSASNYSDVHSSLPVCSSKEGMKATSVTGSGLCNMIPGKPSGLRMPSPKIGFFDGGRSSSRTPKGSVLSRPPVPNGLPKSRVGAVSMKESPDQGKLLKVKPADTLTSINNGKAVKQTSAGIKLITLPEESPIGGRKISSASSNTKSNSLISPKIENKSSSKSSAGSCPNADQVGNEGSVLDTNSSDSSVVVEKSKIGNPGVRKHVGCVQSTGSPEFRSTEVSLLKGINEETSDSSSKCEVKSSERTAVDERCGPHISRIELRSDSDSDGKKQLPAEGQVARLAKMFGAVDLNKGALDESSDATKVCEVSVDKPIFPVTPKDVATTRVPLSPKDSACNTYETLDVLIPENLLEDNS